MSKRKLSKQVVLSAQNKALKETVVLLERHLAAALDVANDRAAQITEADQRMVQFREDLQRREEDEFVRQFIKRTNESPLQHTDIFNVAVGDLRFLVGIIARRGLK